MAGLLAMATWRSGTPIETVALALGAFGFGFGLTVTPRSTAAVEAAGRRAFGVASAVVTVARMIGMAVGLAILTAYGSTTIDRLADEIYATPTSYLQFIPEALRDRPLRDPFVVDALEGWASREAAGIMVGLFVVAAAVTLVAVPPALALGGRRDRGRVCWRAMPPAAKQRTPTTATRSKPASPSRLAPNTIRVAALVGETVKESEGAQALAGLPELCSKPGAAVWVDLTSPSQEQAKAVGTSLALHPLIVEDVLEGNQRAKIETTDGVIHIVLFHLTYDEKVATSELDFVLGPGFLLTVHDASWDPRESNHLRSGLGPVLRHGRTTCCGPWPTTSSTATSRSPTGSATRSTTSRTRSSAGPRRRSSRGSSSSSAS